MDYITVKEAAEKCEIAARRAQVLFAQDEIPGAVCFANTDTGQYQWMQ